VNTNFDLDSKDIPMTFKKLIGRFAAAIGAGIIGLTLIAPESHAASRTEKSFGNWVAVCVENDKGAKRCTIAQQLISKQTRRPVFTVTLSATSKAEQNITIAIPTGVSLRDGITLGVGDQAPVPMSFAVCGPRACTATAPLDPKLLSALQGQPKALANYVRANKKLVQVNVDLAGFSDAYAFMTSQVP
jgi:invasion protein IalB